ncbi:MAG: YeeE/YedE family protein [Thaumarchaeota archaeon]|nr:YeeE/YedE family protein [Nitrososphaerota archaeon]
MSLPPMLPQQVLSFGFVFVYAAFGVSGFILGWVAQRGNYCFVNAMTSVFTTKSYDRFGALLILFGISALMTALLVVTGIVPAVDQYYDNYFSGWYVVVGAIIFGFGATMAGGCNLSMLYRAASGYVQNWLELVGMMVGTYIFAVAIWPFQSFTMANGILSTKLGAYTEYLPYDLFHSVSQISIGITAVALGFPLVAIGLFLQRKTRSKRSAQLGGISGTNLSRALAAPASTGRVGPFPLVGMQTARLSLSDAKEMLLLRKPYGANLSTLILAGALALVFVAGAGYTFNYLVITSSDGGRFLEYILMPFGVNLALNTPWYNDALPILDPSVLMVVMLIVGAFSASLLSGDFKVRVPHQRKRLFTGFSGGILVGIGVRTALGCNIGLMWTNFAQLGYDGILFLFSMLFGVWIAVKVQRHLV